MLEVEYQNVVKKLNIYSYASHCVSKNLTPRRMLKKRFLAAKINRRNNSFQDMYDKL